MACIVFKLEDGSTITTPLDEEQLTLGRADDNVVQLADASVSSHHACIKAREDGWYVQDLGSSNGTRLNGVLIEEALINDGDRVAFGDVHAFFYAEDAPMAAQEVVEEVTPLVVQAAPVTGIPHGASRNPVLHRAPRRKPTVGEGEGCMTFFVICLLFFGAFGLGLCLRHYKQTERFLPNDLVDHFFSKVSRIKIELPEDDKKK